MGTPAYTEIIQNLGHCFTEIRRIEAELAHLRSQLGELSLAARVRRDFPELGDRREQPLQGSQHEKVQSLAEAFKIVFEEIDSYGYTITTGGFGSVESSGYTGFGSTSGNQHDEVSGQVHDARSDESSHSGGVQLEAESGSCGADSRKDF